MAGLTEEATWEAEVYQIEKTDPVVGGPPDLAAGEGITNQPHLELANRTSWLKAKIDALLVQIGVGHGSLLNADMVDGVHASQLARTDAAETFNESITFEDDAFVRGQTYFGNNGDGNSTTYFWDDANDTWRSFFWKNGSSAFFIANEDGSFGKVWNGANDGAGSGLDADKLDGLHASSFARTDVAETFVEDVVFADDATVQGRLYVGQNGGGNSDLYFYDDDADAWRAIYWHNTGHYFSMANSDGSFGKIWNSGNDGAGSGLNADQLDGFHETTFARSARTITAGTGLTGGGALTANRTISADIADYTETIEGTSNVKLMTAFRTRQAVAPAIAALAYGAVGSFVFAARIGGAVYAGSNYAGSGLRPAGVNVPSSLALNTIADGTYSQLFRGGSALSGTWKALGEISHNSSSTYTRTTLFVRIS